MGPPPDTIHHRVTPPCHTAQVPRSTTIDPNRPRLVVLPGPDDPPLAEPVDPARRVAVDVCAVMAGTSDETLVAAPLALPLALSVCMTRHGVGPDGLIAAMRLLRGAVIAESSLDAASEPAPLAAGDARTAALGVAWYLHDLFQRASASNAADRDVLASAAVARLGVPD
jgi:hypothetical protein